MAAARLASAFRYAASTVTGMPVAPSVTPGAPDRADCAWASTAASSTGAASAGVPATAVSVEVGAEVGDAVMVTNVRVGARSSSSATGWSTFVPGGSRTAAAAGAAGDPAGGAYGTATATGSASAPRHPTRRSGSTTVLVARAVGTASEV